MSAFGTKRTWQSPSAMSAFGGKADINRAFPQCLLLTQSGQRHFCLFFVAACSVTKLIKGRRTRLHNVAEDCSLTNSFVVKSESHMSIFSPGVAVND
jgi:hypothetical protein